VGIAQSAIKRSKDRHPERNEVKPKDLHSSHPSTTHQESENAPVAIEPGCPQVREANLGLRAKHEPAKLQRSKTVILSTAKNPNELSSCQGQPEPFSHKTQTSFATRSSYAQSASSFGRAGASALP